MRFWDWREYPFFCRYVLAVFEIWLLSSALLFLARNRQPYMLTSVSMQIIQSSCHRPGCSRALNLSAKFLVGTYFIVISKFYFCSLNFLFGTVQLSDELLEDWSNFFIPCSRRKQGIKTTHRNWLNGRIHDVTEGLNLSLDSRNLESKRLCCLT